MQFRRKRWDCRKPRLLGAGIAVAASSPQRRHRRRTSSSSRAWSIAPAPTPPTASRSPTACADYITMLNERDGGINGVKIAVRGVRDRLRHRPRRRMLRAPQGQGPDRRGLLQPAQHRHHLRADREGAGRQDPADHHGLRPRRQPRRRGVHLELPAARHLLDGGQRRHPAHRQGVGRLRQAQGQEDRAALSRLALRQGADRGARGDVARSTASSSCRSRSPAPGSEQKSQWLQIRQQRPDYVLLWGWGVMNSAAVTEAGNVNYPRDKMIGVWWSGAEPDVIPAGDKGAGYKALMLQHPRRQVRASMRTSRSSSSRQGKSLAKPDEIGAVLYNRGLINSMLGTEVDPHRHGQVRQQADDRRAGALGHRASRPHRRRASSSSASRA